MKSFLIFAEDEGWTIVDGESCTRGGGHLAIRSTGKPDIEVRNAGFWEEFPIRIEAEMAKAVALEDTSL